MKLAADLTPASLGATLFLHGKHLVRMNVANDNISSTCASKCLDG